MVTILFACAICSLFVALGVNSPNRQSIDQINAAQAVRVFRTVTLAALLHEPTPWAGITQCFGLACLLKLLSSTSSMLRHSLLSVEALLCVGSSRHMYSAEVAGERVLTPLLLHMQQLVNGTGNALLSQMYAATPAGANAATLNVRCPCTLCQLSSSQSCHEICAMPSSAACLGRLSPTEPAALQAAHNLQDLVSALHLFPIHFVVSCCLQTLNQTYFGIFDAQQASLPAVCTPPDFMLSNCAAR